MSEPRMLRMMVALALALAGPAAAQEIGLGDRLKSNGFLDVGELCAEVSNPLPVLSPAHPSLRYSFESELADAAGVLPTDTEEQINAKIGTLINNNASRLTCNQVNFSPRNGNILKLAVSRQSNYFIGRVIGNWNVDLNQIDEADGMTVLDYISYRRARTAQSSTYGLTLDRYYKRFRAAGAKHRSELQP
jgi:hypothetical protein